ncbi:hypothetical protein [Sphingobacterium faecium]|uniref:hypothetical protein n=1 Tax=Sphingobacterium faecium TaxID=34087 RepID=UPI002468237D|nr:hypothetical protein [Sphingobacterium faecium]MDH5827313.1 hypothetical protein [Sphingobacterium faecium]
MIRNSYFITLICALCFITFNACKKDNQGSKTARLDVNLTSIYDISKVKIAVFDGWVDAGKQDLSEGSKRFYAVYRSNDSKASLDLDPKHYTVLLYYEDFDALFVEKVDLKAADKAVNFSYNKKLTFMAMVNKLIYLQNEKMSLLISNTNQLAGAKVTFFVNENKVDNLMNNNTFEHVLPKVGINKVEMRVTYKNGETASDYYNFLVVKEKNIDNIWNNIDEKYLKQSMINNQTLVALEKDTLINNVLMKKQTIINGLFGVYKFKFEKEFLTEIEINHGNINQDRTFNFEPIKKKLQSLYGKPIENSYRNFSFISDNFVINLIMDSQTNVVSKITRVK